MCVPSRSTHVKRRRLAGGSISVKPSSSQNATQSRTWSGRTSSDTCWSTCEAYANETSAIPASAAATPVRWVPLTCSRRTARARMTVASG